MSLALGPQLGVLEAGYLIQLEATQPELAYVFRHVLVQDAVYATLVRRERGRLHQAIGEALESLYPDRAETLALAPQLGAHFAEAGDETRALKYLALAGDQAARQYANREAAEYYGRALEIGHRQPAASLAHLYLARGQALELCGDYAQALAGYQAMEAQALAYSNAPMELEALAAQARLRNGFTPVADPVRGRSLVLRGLQLARQLGDRAAEARLLLYQMRSYVWSRDPAQVIVIGEQAVAAARTLGSPQPLVEGLIELAAWGYLNTVRVRLTQERLEEAEALLRDGADPRQRLESLIGLGQVALMRGEFNQMSGLLAEMQQIGQAMGYGWGLSQYHSLRGTVNLEQGNLAEAFPHLEESIRLGRQYSAGQAKLVISAFLARALAMVGEAGAGLAAVRQVRDSMTPDMPNFHWPLLAEGLLLLSLGQVEEADAVIAQAHAWGDARDIIAYRLMLNADAELGLAQGHYADVVRRLHKVIADMRAEDARLLLCEALAYKGRALAGAGDLERAQNTLEEARTLAESIGLRFALWRALAALVEVETRRGHRAEAQELRGELRLLLANLAERAGSPERRAGFLKTRAIQAALQL